MFNLSDFILRKFCKQDENGVYDRSSVASLEAWVSITGNTTLSIIKAILGLSLGSISLMADSLHSASDIITSIVVLIGFKAAQLPPDERHPYGHGRAETTASFIIAILLMLAGVTFGKTSFDRIINPVAVRGSIWVSLAILLSAAFKEWMARFSIYLGNTINSTALIADAWHHRSDALSSVMVAIAILASVYGYFWVDALFGLFVAAFIIYTGYEIANDAISSLLGEAPNPEFLEKIESEAMSVEGVLDVHKINVYDYGQKKRFVSLHIQVNSDANIIEAHNIASIAQDSIAKRFGVEPIIHIEPYLGNNCQPE